MEKHTDCRAHRLIVIMLVCILSGGFLGFRLGVQHRMPDRNEIRSGISEQDLQVHSVVWEDRPAWREITFSIGGRISFITGQNERITLDGLLDPDALEEVRREHNVSVNGKDRIYYDDVTYVIDEGTVKAVIPRVCSGNVIRDTVCSSFYVVFRERSVDHVAGSISLLDGVYQPWTTEEADCFDRNMDAYLSAFTLSGTYEDTDPLRERASKEGVALRKDGGNFLNCTVCNNGSDPWCYGAQLPHVELWYKGVWIELVCPFADNLMTAVVEPGQSRTFDVPEETIMQYPALMDGIYRLVVYGENGDFAVSDTFVVGE